MNDEGPAQRHESGPFGMGRQGWLVVAVIVAGTALVAATRRDWTSLLISALVLPLAMLALLLIVSLLWRDRPQFREQRGGPPRDAGLLTFLARTNLLMFLIAGALGRGADGEGYQEYLRSGPFGMGQIGYLAAFVILLAPLVLTLIILAVMGKLP